MAVYTIYTPPTQKCPLAFVAGDFWQHPEKFSLTVKNVADKPIGQCCLHPKCFWHLRICGAQRTSDGPRQIPCRPVKNQLWRNREFLPKAPRK